MFMGIVKMIVCSVVFCGLFPLIANAQWKSDSTTNTPVCIATASQQNPQACTDGANGVIIVWEDFRSGNNWDVYAQKLNYDGIPQWTANGINICTSNANQTAPVICTDDNGGAYVVWKDSRTSANGIDLYGQHINSNGSLGYGASGSGVGVAKDAAEPDNISICSDGFGNAFVAWADSRSSISPSSSRPDIWMNKLTYNGSVWGFGGSGTAVITASLRQLTPKLVDDGSGGCYLVWESGTLPASIWATRVNSNGTVLWGNLNGIQIFSGQSGTSDASRNPNIYRDGSQLCISWEQLNSSSSTKAWNVLANRVRSDATFVWGNSTVGSEISTDWLGDQINSLIFPDDSDAGVLVVYEDYTGSHDVVMTRLLPNGNDFRPAYPNHIFSVCRQPGDQTFPKAVKTGTGEVLIVWNDTRSNASTGTYSSIYAQRVDKTPKRLIGQQPATTTLGLPVSNRVNSNADQVVLIPRTNGGIAVWRDNRNGNTDIYAQLIFKDGSLPVELDNFSLSARGSGQVLLNWQTASEKDNAGFEVERRLISDPNASKAYEVVGSYLNNTSLLGAGFSNTSRNYSFIDQPAKAGVYEYRLADYSLDGERVNHAPKTIEVLSSSLSDGFSVGQNSPNPFKDKTIIPINLPQSASVELVVSDVLGRVIATPFNGILEGGSHSLTINSSMLGNSSGAYYYSITIRDPQTNSILWKMPKAEMMVRFVN